MDEKIKIIENLDFPIYVKVAFFKKLGFSFSEIQYFKGCDKPEKILRNYFKRYQDHGGFHSLQPMYDNLTAILAIKLQNITLSDKALFIKNLDRDFFNMRMISNLLEVTVKDIEHQMKLDRHANKKERMENEIKGLEIEIKEIMESNNHQYVKAHQIKSLELSNEVVAYYLNTSQKEVSHFLKHYREQNKKGARKTIEDYRGRLEHILKTDKTDEEKIFHIRNLDNKVFTYTVIAKLFHRSANYATNAYKRFLRKVEPESEKLKRIRKNKPRVVGAGHKFTSIFNPIIDKPIPGQFEKSKTTKKGKARQNDNSKPTVFNQNLEKVA